jgi:hypothetical protein
VRTPGDEGTAPDPTPRRANDGDVGDSAGPHGADQPGSGWGRTIGQEALNAMSHEHLVQAIARYKAANERTTAARKHQQENQNPRETVGSGWWVPMDDSRAQSKVSKATTRRVVKGRPPTGPLH